MQINFNPFRLLPYSFFFVSFFVAFGAAFFVVFFVVFFLLSPPFAMISWFPQRLICLLLFLWGSYSSLC